MGFLDSFLGKRSNAQKSAERMKLADLPGWANKGRGELCAEPEGKTDPAAERAVLAVNYIKDAIAGLEKAEMQKDVPQRIKSVVVSSRDNYVSRINKVIGSIDTTASPIELSDLLCKALEGVREIDMKYGGRVNFGFPDELSRVKKELNVLVDASNGLNSHLEGRKKRLKLLGEIEGMLKEANDSLEEIKKLESQKSHSVKELEEIKNLKGKKESDVGKIEASEQVVNVRVMKAEMAKLVERKQEIEVFVLNVLGPLKRALKKFARVAGDKSVSANAERYAEEPVETYLRDDNGLPELAAKVMKAVQSKSLGLDQDESEKTVRKIRAICFPHLEKARSEYITITSKIRGLEVKIRDFDLDGEIDKARREVEGLNYKLESEPKAIEKLGESIAEEKMKLEEMKIKLAEKLSDFTGNRCEVV